MSEGEEKTKKGEVKMREGREGEARRGGEEEGR